MTDNHGGDNAGLQRVNHEFTKTIVAAGVGASMWFLAFPLLLAGEVYGNGTLQLIGGLLGVAGVVAYTLLSGDDIDD